MEEKYEIGKTKSYCSVQTEWAPDGLHFITAVLHKRVKVDNEIKIFKANGELMVKKCYKEQELHKVQWQPCKPGIFPEPNLYILRMNQKQEDEKKAPAKFFRHGGGGNSAF